MHADDTFYASHSGYSIDLFIRQIGHDLICFIELAQPSCAVATGIFQTAYTAWT